MSPELMEAIRSTINNCKILLGNPRQPPPNVLRTHHGLDTPFNSSSIGAQVKLNYTYQFKVNLVI
jgi:hypothetical protein